MTLSKLNKEIINCRKCNRLVNFREKIAKEKRKQYQDQIYWGKPINGYGDQNARLLMVGLAPAAHGGNRTGRVFTGDKSADFLFKCLYEAGFSYPGHTEFLASFGDVDIGGPMMMLACKDLKVVPLTVHLPITEVASNLSKEAIIKSNLLDI